MENSSTLDAGKPVPDAREARKAAPAVGEPRKADAVTPLRPKATNTKVTDSPRWADSGVEAAEGEPVGDATTTTVWDGVAVAEDAAWLARGLATAVLEPEPVGSADAPMTLGALLMLAAAEEADCEAATVTDAVPVAAMLLEATAGVDEPVAGILPTAAEGEPEALAVTADSLGETAATDADGASTLEAAGDAEDDPDTEALLVAEADADTVGVGNDSALTEAITVALAEALTDEDEYGCTLGKADAEALTDTEVEASMTTGMAEALHQDETMSAGGKTIVSR
jgi:hypothetical protein